jgi:hypothetical protein
MNPEQLASYNAATAAEQARHRSHTPPRTSEDFAYYEQLARDLDAAPSLSEYFNELGPPYPQPCVDEDTMLAIDQAIDLLAAQRRLVWLGDGAVQVHVIASLTAELRTRLGHAIALAHDQETTWSDIAQLAGLSLTETKNLSDPVDTQPD